MRLSVIICVYNTDRAYFEECLKSITESTLTKGEYEIVVVDDGSGIDYTDLITRYGARYTKTENRGMLAARSLGISMACGRWCVFVDSDDTVSFNYHRPMLERAEQTGADIVLSDWAFHTVRSRYYCKTDSVIATDIAAVGEDVLPLLFRHGGAQHSYFVLWNKLFKTELLRKVCEDVRDTEEGFGKFNYSEDALRCFYAYKRAQRVVNVHSGGYYFYRIHASQSVNVVGIDTLRGQIACMRETFLAMERGLCDHPRADEMREGLMRWRALSARSHYSYARAGGYAELYPVIREAYGVERLRISTLADSRVYINNCPLPTNIREVDEALLKLYSEGSGSICPCGTGTYTRAAVRGLRSIGCTVEYVRGAAVIPEESYRLRDKIIMNPIVYTASLLLFPKGSRLRAFLKRHI